MCHSTSSLSLLLHCDCQVSLLIREQLVRRARDFHIVVMDVSIVSALHREDFSCNGGCVHYIIESKVQWKPFWLATQQYPQNDWLGGNCPYAVTYAHSPPLTKQKEGRGWGMIHFTSVIRIIALSLCYL